MPTELSSTEAALRAGLSRERIVRAVLRGELRARLISGRWAIDERSFERFLRDQQGELAPAASPNNGASSHA